MRQERDLQGDIFCLARYAYVAPAPVSVRRLHVKRIQPAAGRAYTRGREEANIFVPLVHIDSSIELGIEQDAEQHPIEY